MAAPVIPRCDLRPGPCGEFISCPDRPVSHRHLGELTEELAPGGPPASRHRANGLTGPAAGRLSRAGMVDEEYPYLADEARRG